MSDTPRTDVEAEENGLNRVVSADFARQLERELSHATNALRFPEATLEAFNSLHREVDYLRDQLKMCAESGRQADKANRARIAELVGDVAEAKRLIDECAPYLKEGETPAERIKREFLDCQAVTKLLEEARRIIEQRDLRDEQDAQAQLRMQKELAEARREIEVWSRRYADLEVLYLAATKS